MKNGEVMKYYIHAPTKKGVLTTKSDFVGVWEIPHMTRFLVPLDLHTTITTIFHIFVTVSQCKLSKISGNFK